MNTNEEWKTISENERYSVSDKGRVRNNETGHILKGVLLPKGYVKVNLHNVDGSRKNKLIHRLVATAFIENPEQKPEVNHKNGIKNDNRVENLEWVTGEENRKHAYETGIVRHKDNRYSGYLYNIWKQHHRNNMCIEWQDYLKFYEWCYKNGYKDSLYVSLRNTAGKYTPENCIISGKRPHKSKLYMCYGKMLSLKEISSRYGVLKNTLNYRIKQGMSIENAINKRVAKAEK